MKKKSFVFAGLVLLLVLLASGVWAESIESLEAKLEKDPDNVALLKEVGIHYHTLADKGDQKAVKKALDCFERARELAPDDYALKAWYGSVLAMVGRDAVNPLTKYFKVKEGLELMDEAVEKYPDDYEIRMTRAMTTKNLPTDIFSRLGESVNDFGYLINKEKETPGYLPALEKRLVYLHLGLALKDGGDLETATKAWRKLIEFAPDSEEAAEAKKLLDKYDI